MLILLIYYYTCMFALNVYFVCGMQTMFFAVHKNDKLLTNKNSYLARFENYWGSNCGLHGKAGRLLCHM